MFIYTYQTYQNFILNSNAPLLWPNCWSCFFYYLCLNKWVDGCEIIIILPIRKWFTLKKKSKVVKSPVKAGLIITTKYNAKGWILWRKKFDPSLPSPHTLLSQYIPQTFPSSFKDLIQAPSSFKKSMIEYAEYSPPPPFFQTPTPLSAAIFCKLTTPPLSLFLPFNPLKARPFPHTTPIVNYLMKSAFIRLFETWLKRLLAQKISFLFHLRAVSKI